MFTHITMLLLEHTPQQSASFVGTHLLTSKNLLPAMPDEIVAVVHPVHVAGPVVVEAEPSAVEANGSGNDGRKVARSKPITKRSATVESAAIITASEAAVTPHLNRIVGSKFEQVVVVFVKVRNVAHAVEQAFAWEMRDRFEDSGGRKRRYKDTK